MYGIRQIGNITVFDTPVIQLVKNVLIIPVDTHQSKERKKDIKKHITHGVFNVLATTQCFNYSA